MTKREKILQVLDTMPKSDAIKLIESIGKQLRRENSIRISSFINSLIVSTKK